MPPELIYRVHGRWVHYPLERDEITIGRDAHNDLVIEHPSVSRRHARLKRTAEGWRITDRGSRFGTRINDLGHSNALLRHGDTVYLHKFELSFVDEEGSRAALVQGTGGGVEPGDGTVFHDTVDFSRLAEGAADAAHLQKLLTIVTEASRAILVSDSLDQIFQRLLELVFEHLPVQRGFIMLWDAEQGEFRTECVRHREQRDEGSEPIRFSRTIAEKVVRERVAVMTTDAQADGRFASGESIFELGIRSAIAAPLWRGDEVDGLIYADTSEMARAFDRFDLDILSALGNHLAVAVAQSRLQRSIVEQRVARRRLERYHSPAVVERILSEPEQSDELMADEREVSVLFADIVDFTARCESLEPPAVARLLNRYFGEMTRIIFGHEGTLDKFIGDCLMAVFGAPIPADDHARRAVDAALDMREALAELNEPLPPDERVEFRVGVHSGSVVAGDIGSSLRSDYTVLGVTVNIAARLEALVALPGQIVISGVTLEGLGEGYRVHPLGEQSLKGVTGRMRCFEVLGRGPE